LGQPTGGVLEVVREHLDNDLDTPSALAAIDAAALSGENVGSAAALLGIDLVDPMSPSASH
jgi:L-cysteine:1D-myo-inositol 2-amino-2-deoxy-alpha-D-glucopyranoside ligase